MQQDAMLRQLGYVPNEALLEQLTKIEKNTREYEKIQKHIVDLHNSLQVNKSYVALSNSKSYLKVKIETPLEASKEDAHEKILRFSEKYKIEVEKLPNKETYYILGFKN